MGNCTFSVQSDGAYVTYVPTGGADPVSKKLGEPTLTFISSSNVGVGQTVKLTFSEIGLYLIVVGSANEYADKSTISITSSGGTLSVLQNVCNQNTGNQTSLGLVVAIFDVTAISDTVSVTYNSAAVGTHTIFKIG